MGCNDKQEVIEYMESFDELTKQRLYCIHALIKEVIPDVEERLSWGVPTYYKEGYLLQIAAYKKHIGFYTNNTTLQHFKKQLSGYKTNNKNTLQLSLQEDIPISLLKEMIVFRLQENQKDK